MASTAPKEQADAASQSSDTSPLLGLPNELLDAIVGFIAEDTSRIGSGPKPWLGQGQISLGNLALAIRRCQPFIRFRLLQKIVISSSERIEAVISWLEAMPVERYAVRQIRVTAVNLTTGTHGDLVSQPRLAHLLALVPNLRKLDVSKWSSSKVIPKLRLSLNGLTMLETLWFQASQGSRGRTQGCSALLAALPDGHCLRCLLLDLPWFAHGQRDEPLIVPPPRMTVLQIHFPTSVVSSRHFLFDETDFTFFGSRLTVLNMSAVWMSSNLFRRLGSTLKALYFDADSCGAWLSIEMPNLTTIYCRNFGWGDHPLLETRMVDRALFRHTKTLVLELTKQGQDLSHFLSGCTTLERLVVVDWKHHGLLRIVQDTPQKERLQSILPKAKIEIMGGSLLYPDLLKLVETGGAVEALQMPRVVF